MFQDERVLKMAESKIGDSLGKKVRLAVAGNNVEELALGFLRYDALRKLNARQYAEICRRNLAGERFDDMVTEMVVKGVQG